LPTLIHTIPRSNINKGVGSLATYGNQLFVGCNGAAQVEVYDTTTWASERRLSIPGLGSKVFGLAVCGYNQCLYVSDTKLSRVHKVDLSTYNVALKWSVTAEPWGLSVNSAHNVLVACRLANKVQEYSSVGSFIREIRTANSQPTCVIQLSNGQLAVSHCCEVHVVCLMGDDGKAVKTFGNQVDSAMTRFHCPYCLVVDGHGYVLVADCHNHRIVALNPTWTDARDLPLSVDCGLQWPSSMCYDKSRGRLYIGEDGGKRRILVFDMSVYRNWHQQ
jgi:DNA-binding beta-propeller fold protein YncE